MFSLALPQKRKKSYDMTFELKAVEVAEKKSKEVHVAAHEFCIAFSISLAMSVIASWVCAYWHDEWKK